MKGKSKKNTIIYYTGMGSNVTGRHTVEEFLDIMKKNFDIECSTSALDYKPCSDAFKMENDSKAGFQHSRKYKNALKKCNEHKKTAKHKKCDLKTFIKFSGAGT